MKNRRTVLACVTPQPSSEVIMKAARTVAEKNDATLEAVCVLPVADGENPVDCQALERVYRAARSNGGETALYFSDAPVLTVAAHIAVRKPIAVVTGFPGEKGKGFVLALRLMFPEIPITMVGGNADAYAVLSAGTLTAGEGCAVKTSDSNLS